MIMNTDNTDIKDRIKAIIVDKLGVDETEVNDDANLMEDLGADSLDTVELIMEFEKTFDIKISDELSEKIHNVGDIYNTVEELVSSQD